MHHLAGHANVTLIKGAFEDKHNVHLVSRSCLSRHRGARLAYGRGSRHGNGSHCLAEATRVRAAQVMELCSGGELFDRIVARGHYSEADAAAMCRTIVKVVAHCHSLGVIHRCGPGGSVARLRKRRACLPHLQWLLCPRCAAVCRLHDTRGCCNVAVWCGAAFSGT